MVDMQKTLKKIEETKKMTANLIYEASPGQVPLTAAKEAIKLGCWRFIYQDQIFQLDITWEKIGEIKDVEPEVKKAVTDPPPDLQPSVEEF